MAPVRRSNPTPSHSSFIVAMPSPLACAQGASRGTSSAAGLARGHSRSAAARALCTEPHKTAASPAYSWCVTAEPDFLCYATAPTCPCRSSSGLGQQSTRSSITNRLEVTLTVVFCCPGTAAHSSILGRTTVYEYFAYRSLNTCYAM